MAFDTLCAETFVAWCRVPKSRKFVVWMALTILLQNQGLLVCFRVRLIIFLCFA